jgi:hypothetical protein
VISAKELRVLAADLRREMRPETRAEAADKARRYRAWAKRHPETTDAAGYLREAQEIERELEATK